VQNIQSIELSLGPEAQNIEKQVFICKILIANEMQVFVRMRFWELLSFYGIGHNSSAAHMSFGMSSVCRFWT
jgi:hypothetical protein